MAAVAPNVIGAVGRLLDLDGREQRKRYDSIWQSFHRLKKGKALEFVGEKDGVSIYRPSLLGMKKIRKVVYDELKIESPRRWDRRWRLVIFDIPERFKRARDGLKVLYHFGPLLKIPS